jgi:hypothetical protein
LRGLRLVLCTASAACASAPARPAPTLPEAVAGYSGTDCVEVVHVRPTPPEVATRLLPDGYDLALGTDGQAQVVFALYGCRAFAVDGGRAPGGVVAEHAVRIEAPDERTTVRGSVRADHFEASWIGDPVVEPLEGPVDPNAKGVTFWLQSGKGRVQLDYSSRLRPRSTGTVTVRSDGVETSGEGAYLKFDATVRVVR